MLKNCVSLYQILVANVNRDSIKTINHLLHSAGNASSPFANIDARFAQCSLARTVQ
jgi:hypothetical protein